MAVVVSRFEVHLVRLDPTEGREIRKTRPCLIISPDEMNRHIDTLILAPMTTKGRAYPTRVPVRFQRKTGQSPRLAQRDVCAITSARSTPARAAP